MSSVLLVVPPLDASVVPPVSPVGALESRVAPSLPPVVSLALAVPSLLASTVLDSSPRGGVSRSDAALNPVPCSTDVSSPGTPEDESLDVSVAPWTSATIDVCVASSPVARIASSPPWVRAKATPPRATNATNAAAATKRTGFFFSLASSMGANSGIVRSRRGIATVTGPVAAAPPASIDAARRRLANSPADSGRSAGSFAIDCVTMDAIGSGIPVVASSSGSSLMTRIITAASVSFSPVRNGAVPVRSAASVAPSP